MTGLEKLNGMTVEKAAKLLGGGCPYPNFFGFCPNGAGLAKCETCWLEWLNAEEEDSKAAEQQMISEVI